MAVAEPTPTPAPFERRVRRARRVAAVLQGLAYVLMLAAVWGAPIRAVLVAARSDAPLWTDPWRMWAMAEWSVACLVGSYLLWVLADVLREEFPDFD